MIQFLVQVDWIMLVRLLIAALCGAAIGFERDHRHKDAGLKTHMILAMGAALAMQVSKYGFSDVGVFDAARIAAGVVSGIGFLGAGIIFVRNNLVNGLTTAAGLWTTSVIGLAVGSGLYVIAIFATAIIVVIHFLLRQHFISEIIRKHQINLSVTVAHLDIIDDIITYFQEDESVFCRIEKIEKADQGYRVDLEFLSDTPTHTIQFAKYLSSAEDIISFRFLT